MRCLGWLIATDPDAEEPRPSKSASPSLNVSDADLNFLEREVRSLQAQEDDRDRGVQARLVAILGLSSLVTAVLAGAVALVRTVDLQITPIQLLVVLLAFSYIAVQAIAAMLFTIRGLMPRTYPIGQAWPERQSGDESPARSRSSILSGHMADLSQSRWSTNRRIEDMVLALRSLKRFAWGSASLLAALVVIVLLQQLDICIALV